MFWFINNHILAGLGGLSLNTMANSGLSSQLSCYLVIMI